MKYFLIFIALFFASCQQNSASSHQTLRWNIGKEPQTLDPRKARDIWGVTLMRALFEGLTRISREGEVEMALAKEVDISEDGCTYTFHLRKSFWSNGDAVTAFDFAASWKSMLRPDFPTDIADQLYGIKNARKAKMGEVNLSEVGVEAPNAETLIVHLEHPIPYFLELLSLSAFLPVSQRAPENWALQPSTYVCNGPFLLSSWDHSNELQVKKNPRYWQADEVKLQGMELVMLSRDTEMQLFEDGKLDWAGSPLSSLPHDALPSLKGEGKLKIGDFSGTSFLRVNTSTQIQGQKNPLSNSLFRKALAVAIDRSAITEHLLQGGQRPARSLVPPEMGLAQRGYFSDADPQRAYALFIDALLALDLPRDKLQPITLLYAIDERNAAVVQSLQQQWKVALGIDVILEAVELKLFFQRVNNKEYQLSLGSWLADFNDPSNFLELFQYRNSPRNNTEWEHPKYIDLLNRSALCKGIEERRAFLREAEQVLMEQMPIIPVYHAAMNYLKEDRLEGVALSPLGLVDFRWASFR